MQASFVFSSCSVKAIRLNRDYAKLFVDEESEPGIPVRWLRHPGYGTEYDVALAACTQACPYISVSRAWYRGQQEKEIPALADNKAFNSVPSHVRNSSVAREK